MVRPAAVVCSILAVAGLAACSNDPYDRGGLQDDLVDAGLTSDEATCVIEGLEERLGERDLSARVDATAAQRQAFDEVFARCTS